MPVPINLVTVDIAELVAWAERVIAATHLNPAHTGLDLAAIRLAPGSVQSTQAAHIGIFSVDGLRQLLQLVVVVIGDHHQIGAALGLHPQHAVDSRGDEVVDSDGLPALIECLFHRRWQLVVVVVGASSIGKASPVRLAIDIAHQFEQARGIEAAFFRGLGLGVDHQLAIQCLGLREDSGLTMRAGIRARISWAIM
ncbi:hypothetical protein D3C80_872770 [compost metagenome]